MKTADGKYICGYCKKNEAAQQHAKAYYDGDIKDDIWIEEFSMDPASIIHYCKDCEEQKYEEGVG